MKPSLLLTTLIYLSINVSYGQVEPQIDYKARAEKNLKLLVKDSILLNQVAIKSDGIYLYDRSSTKPDFILYWNEVGHFLRLCYNLNYYQMLDLYNTKRNGHFHLDDVMDFKEYSLAASDLMGGLRVAIDPGHFAGTWEEALQEKRYVKVKPDELGLPESAGDQKAMEAELTYFTAEALADSLQKLGAFTLITRERGNSAVGKKFEQWYQEDFQNDLKKYIASGDISAEMARLLQSESKYYVFENFYKYIDFVQRSRKINEFHPDITIVIHYNADETNERVKDRYSKLSDNNYSMVFIPGAFVWGELYKINARIEFLRLLVSPDLEQSERFAGLMIKNLKALGVQPIPFNNDLNHPKRYCIESEFEGVYHRNIYLTRAIEGPMVYLECSYQDSRQEFPLLLKRDYKLNGVKMPMRCVQYSSKILVTIKEWLESNKGVDLVR